MNKQRKLQGRQPTKAETAAILANDARADGRFIYAVSSTGIFCHPSCPSRPPKPENIRIYPDADAAAADGLLACKRCRPDQPGHDKRLLRARALIDARIDAGEAPPSLAELGKAAHASPSHLQRRFAAAFGLSPKAYAEARRLQTLKRELKGGADVAQAIYGAGFGATSRVYEKSDKLLGMTPADYKRGGEGLTLTYSLKAWPLKPSLGRVLLARSPRGLAALLLGANDAAMLAELRGEFPAATLLRDDAANDAALAAMTALLHGRALPKNLPLDLRGTPFQIRVWQALQAIPHGETRSYAQIAAMLGMPRASRAVGSACANNILGLLVPCHRALRSDGGLGGYRWGLDRKQAILDMETEAA
ncbi:bifunctional transcriptional activator/DNA repair enzyme AdaA [Ferrovibrio sp.]|uniref:bifunctional transcriptional activator/DNA repair enzyme AdaA n=1 Tax=Ferrovibrio sp. TaxID=1917215 RepID=UPI0035B28563